MKRFAPLVAVLSLIPMAVAADPSVPPPGPAVTTNEHAPGTIDPSLSTSTLDPATGKEPTPEAIYAASHAPFGTMVRVYNLKQEFVLQNDGTYRGVVKPTFDQAKSVPWWSTEKIENVIGPWDAVSRRIGGIHNTSGKLVSIEDAFQIATADRAAYLVVTSVDSSTKPGVRKCAASVVGVLLARPWGPDDKEKLVSRPYGTLSGCGLVKDVLTVAAPDYGKTSDALTAWHMAQDQFLDAMAKELGFRLYRKTITLDPAIVKAGEGKP
jgi:hypothetical protein